MVCTGKHTYRKKGPGPGQCYNVQDILISSLIGCPVYIIPSANGGIYLPVSDLNHPKPKYPPGRQYQTRACLSLPR